MFDATPFTSHAGLALPWKIDCDSLTDADWDCVAQVVAKMHTFGKVVGVPSGGLRFAEALRRYATPGSDLTLVVDDVLTTGVSMNEVARTLAGRPVRGVVLFCRGATKPGWVSSVFNLSAEFTGVG